MRDGRDMLNKDWKNKIRWAKPIYAGALYSLLALSASVEALTLEDIEFSVQSEGRLQIQLNMDGPAFEPKVFRTDNPARIAFDFPGVENGMKQKIVPVNVGATTGLHVIEAGGRTRVVINLLDQTPFETTVQGNQLLVTLQNNQGSADTPVSGGFTDSTPEPQTIDSIGQSITNIDFRRGKQGEGRVLISLTDPNAVVDVQEQGGKVVLYFMNTDLPEHLAKKLDVTDFATPVESVETSMQGGRPKMVITPLNSQYDYLSYQSEGLLTLEFRSLTQAEQIEIKKKKFAFSGERLSLNFQDIPVRSVLQILADFTEMNIVAADSVKGNVTLRLNNVPWDQALDMILKSKGLGQRQEGNIMRIAPVAELNKQEKEELEAIQFKEELEPLKIEFIQVKYAKASDIKKVISGFKDNEPLTTRIGGNYIADPGSSGGNSSMNRSSILSSRGVVNIDERTNLLIVKDTGRNLEAIRRLVRELDTPVRQVLIEARVVVASNDFTRDLGFRLGAAKNLDRNNNDLLSEVSGRLANNLLIDLAASSPAGAMGFTMAKIGNYLLDLEISALEKDGKGEVISSPRIVTSDKQTAEISQGFEIPYSTTSQNGTNTQFKKAELKLEVTPLITPDDQVQMELTITKDVPLSTQAGAEPALETREIKTTVQVGNGETIVLGGVYEGQGSHANKRIPFFGDLPGIGFLFQQNLDFDSKKELLIFITPKILKDSLQTL